MENEIWLAINGYESLYQISNRGRIRSLDKSWVNNKGGICRKAGKLLTPDTTNGYFHIKLWQNGRFKWFQIHQLVAIAFIENPESKPHVNHLNSNRGDNRVENLEWCTPKENLAHASERGRLKNNNGKMVVDRTTGQRYKSCKEASEASGYNYQTLRAYLNGGLSNRSQFEYI